MKVNIIRTYKGKTTSESVAEFFPSQLDSYLQFLLMQGIEINIADAQYELSRVELTYKIPIEV